ncbi:MAG: metallophosphoesterase [Cephaloticoccus sp.]|nr:metallophosphoesterase [Cephaloticoccus sp.]MCF7759840.1 metallophosphoesterase [Cephaloticoccus sp.]
MRIAIIADIHGNLPALEAVLTTLDAMKPDQVIVAGDIVDGAPDSAACWACIKAMGWPILRGNHERYVMDYGTERAEPVWSTPQFAPLQYTHRTMSTAQRAEMALLPMEWHSEAAPGLLIVHASQRSDADSILPHTPAAEIDAMFSEPGAQFIVRSHNHIGSTREWRGRRIVTTGAVGLPLDGQTRAQFCLVTLRDRCWAVEHHAVRYDVAAAERRFHDSGYLNETGTLGRMFMREVTTGAHHVVPFLRYYGLRKQLETGLSIAQAEKEFFL